MESIGTAILFIAINFSDGNILVVATGILTAAVVSGKLTGAHFNTSVTLAVLIAEGFDKMKGNLKQTLVMIVSQFVGGYVGSLFSLIELGSDDIAVVKPADNASPLRVFVVELFFTFILMCCILHNIYPRLSIQTDMVLAVVAVTASIYFCASCAGSISGAVFNPVVGVVNLTFVAMVRSGTGQRNYLEYLPAYLFATLLGGIFAGFFCKYLVMPSVPNYY